MFTSVYKTNVLNVIFGKAQVQFFVDHVHAFFLSIGKKIGYS